MKNHIGMLVIAGLCGFWAGVVQAVDFNCWVSVPGRIYGVNWVESLTNSFQPLPPTDIYYPVNSYTDAAHGAEAKGFYRLDVRLEP